jgi:hypothetical protein
MQGVPTGVQLVGKKWEDEKVLAMMHVVDGTLGPRGFSPGSWKPRQTVILNSAAGTLKLFIRYQILYYIYILIGLHSIMTM